MVFSKFYKFTKFPKQNAPFVVCFSFVSFIPLKLFIFITFQIKKLKILILHFIDFLEKKANLLASMNKYAKVQIKYMLYKKLQTVVNETFLDKHNGLCLTFSFLEILNLQSKMAYCVTKCPHTLGLVLFGSHATCLKQVWFLSKLFSFRCLQN